MTRPNSARTAATIFLLAFATGLLTTTVSFNWDLIRGVPLRGRAATITVSKALVEDEFLDFVHNSAGKISESDGEIEPGDVFCNRELAMSTIEAIGFDMDYTIAQYKPEFDLLAFDGALAKLAGLGYPPVLHFQYKPERFTRGLVLDKRRGNILKWTATNTFAWRLTAAESSAGRRPKLIVVQMGIKCLRTRAGTV